MRPLSASLKESLAQATDQYAKSVDLAEEYLTARGIGPELAETFRLGVVAEPIPGHEEYADRLSIPYLGARGSVYGMRFRTLDGDGPKYLGIHGTPTRLFNLRALHESDLPFMCITEGELDCVALAASGLPGIGVPGSNNWKRHHPRLFAGFDAVYVLGDGDKAGRKFTQEVSASLRSARPVTLPDGADVNSLLVSDGPEAIRELLGV